jgi:hypothetical protein
MKDTNLFRICLLITLIYVVMLFVSVARQKITLSNGVRLFILVFLPFLALVMAPFHLKNFGYQDYQFDGSLNLLVYISILQIVFFMHYLILKLNKLEKSRILLIQEIALLRYKTDSK